MQIIYKWTRNNKPYSTCPYTGSYAKTMENLEEKDGIGTRQQVSQHMRKKSYYGIYQYTQMENVRLINRTQLAEKYQEKENAM